MVLTASEGISLSNTTVKVSATAIYTPELSISNSVINSSGLGYSSGTGPGCGYFDEVLNQLLGCTGTGASHGGYGGNSNPENCNLLVSSPPYNRELIPKYPGSGGGFFLKELTEVSSGGGVINIQVHQLTVVDSCFLANGVAGVQGGGGGSGGSVSIDFSFADLTDKVRISANGGNARSSGGGGRVRFFYHNWANWDQSFNDSILRIEALGGVKCETNLTCGQMGSVVASPCPPGYHLDFENYICMACPVGYYQITYGYSTCSECASKPANSYYSQPSSGQLNNYSHVCRFTCHDGYSDG